MDTRFPTKLLLLPFFAALMLLGALVWLFTASTELAPGPNAQRLAQVQRSELRGAAIPARDTVDFITMEIRDVVPLPEAQTHAVVLVANKGDTILPVFVDEETAIAVAMRLAHRESPHPLAADLLGGVMTRLGATLVSVKLDALVANEYTGSVRLKHSEGEFDVSARPSDALALAAENGAPVLASPSLIHELGITREQIEELRKSLPGLDESGPGVGGSGKAQDPALPPGIEL